MAAAPWLHREPAEPLPLWFAVIQWVAAPAESGSQGTRTQSEPWGRPQIIQEVSGQGAGSGCPCPSDPEHGGETWQGRRNHILAKWGLGNQQTLNFKYFLQCLLIAQRTNSHLTPVPSQLCPPSRVRAKWGWRRHRRDGISPRWYHTLATSLCFSLFLFPSHKTSRLITHLPQAGQQLMSVPKALSAP